MGAEIHQTGPIEKVIVHSDSFETQLIERLTRIETKQDYAHDYIKGHEVRIAKLEERVPDPDHESRLRKLERAIWVASGTALAGGGVLGTVLSSVTGA